jgi:hypothetical protein
MYFVEFGNGIIGVFNKETYAKIPTEDLSLFSSEFKDYENEIKVHQKYYGHILGIITQEIILPKE